jgi:hypothetical protein
MQRSLAAYFRQTLLRRVWRKSAVAGRRVLACCGSSCGFQVASRRFGDGGGCSVNVYAKSKRLRNGSPMSWRQTRADCGHLDGQRASRPSAWTFNPMRGGNTAQRCTLLLSLTRSFGRKCEASTSKLSGRTMIGPLRNALSRQRPACGRRCGPFASSCSYARARRASRSGAT